MMKNLAMLAALVLLGLAGTAKAEISAASKIPSYLAGRDDLAVKRSDLDSKREEIQEKINAQNELCSRVASDSPLVETCRSNQVSIMADIKAYKASLEAYETLLSQASKPSPYENLIMIREQIKRDLEQAKERRGQAVLQKSRLESILETAQAGKHTPDLDEETFNQILKAAPGGIEEAKQVLSETEAEIQKLEMRSQWTERAIKNLDESMKPERGREDSAKYALGFGMVLSGPATANVGLVRAGHDGAIPLGDNSFMAGDEVVTDKMGHAELSSLGASNYVIALDNQTRLKLEEDHKERGTVWTLNEGRIHSSPIVPEYPQPPARIRTRDSVIQGSPDSEFDVRINAKGETTLEVYRGKVEVQEPAKGTSYFVEADTADGPEVTPWWK